jgi:hypothetical protein
VPNSPYTFPCTNPSLGHSGAECQCLQVHDRYDRPASARQHQASEYAPACRVEPTGKPQKRASKCQVQTIAHWQSNLCTGGICAAAFSASAVTEVLAQLSESSESLVSSSSVSFPPLSHPHRHGTASAPGALQHVSRRFNQS